jgi:hypothetical protein
MPDGLERLTNRAGGRRSTRERLRVGCEGDVVSRPAFGGSTWAGATFVSLLPRPDLAGNSTRIATIDHSRRMGRRGSGVTSTTQGVQSDGGKGEYVN